MNERIRQLAEQAESSRLEYNSATMMTERIQEFDKAKFAQLIVRECAGILMKPEYVMNHPEELSDYNEGWVNGRLLGIKHIKEHFGVEE